MNEGRVAIISGGTSGIGRALVEGLLADGYRVGFSARHQSGIQRTLTALHASHERLVGIVGDAVKPDHATVLFEAAFRAFSAWPSLFVVCAGHGLPGTLTGSDLRRWESLIQLNVLGTMYQLRVAAEQFSSTPSDTVKDLVVLGSTVGRTLSEANPVYGATKVALHALVESLRRELCGRGVRVTLIEPGFVISGFQAAAGYDPGWFASIERDQGPLLQPKDIARIIRFVVQQPPHVHIDDVRVRPTRQRV